MSTEQPGLRAETVDHYLETVFYIQGEGEPVRPGRIAEWIGVRPPSVSEVLKRLEGSGWITVAEDRSVTMTAKGQDRAERIVRGHRLLERWLTDTLGLDWASADEEAQRLVPGLSDTTAEALDAYLQHPSTCPHGNVIPGRSAPYGTLVALDTLAAGDSATVRRISEVAEHDAPELLRRLEEAGVVPGTKVDVPAAAGLGVIDLVLNGQTTTAISQETATFIWVEPTA